MGLTQTYDSIFPGPADTTEIHPQAPDLPATRKWLFLLQGWRKFIGKGTDRAHRIAGEFTPLSPQLTSGKEGNCKAVLESLRAKEQSFLLLAWFPTMFAVCSITVSYSTGGHHYGRGANEGENNPGSSLLAVTEQAFSAAPPGHPAAWWSDMTGVTFKLFAHPFPAITPVKCARVYVYILRM